MNTGKVWYVTGASQRLGSSLEKKLLSRRYCVPATSRNLQILNDRPGLLTSREVIGLKKFNNK